MAIYSVDGHFKDAADEVFYGYLVSDTYDAPAGYSDEDIFFYGVSEKDLIGEHDDFVITRYVSVAEISTTK